MLDRSTYPILVLAVQVREGGRVFGRFLHGIVRNGTYRGAGPHAPVALLTLILFGILGMSCARMVPPRATAVNPPTFPQAVPPAIPPIPPDLPPVVTENRTFVTREGVPQYKIGPGDLLDILITRGSTQEKVQTHVRPNGRVSISFVDVPVDGLTVEQATQAITRELSVYFRNPMVEVQVKEFNSKKVSILGAVGATPRGGIGTLPLTGRTTLLELIARAGGLAPNASLERVRVTRETGKVYTVNMFRYIQEGDLSQEFILDSGDVVFVPERVPGEERRVFLLGEVKTPGPVPFFPTLTLAQLMAQAGGWTEGALFEEARIIRSDLTATEIIGIDLGRLILDGERRIDQFLRPNDVVFIPRTRIANWNAFLAQLRPTFEFFAIPFQPFFIIRSLER
jgi:polysaccharide export outer membrane protein